MSVKSPPRFDARRAVAVVESDRLVASGYLVTGSLVLTCSHALGSGPWVVRRPRDEAAVPVTGSIRSPEADIALLELAVEVDDLPPVVLGAVDPFGVQNLQFEMYGWPLWASEVGDAWQLLDGGRLVRGRFEPADVSPDASIVLQPDRHGAVRSDGRSDWEGMSGAAVFSLDRLVGVQRRHANPQLAGAIEARPITAIPVESDLGTALAAGSVLLDRDWAKTGSRATGRRLELHGPSEVSLLSVSTFFVRADGFTRLSWSLGGLGRPRSGSWSEAGPLLEITFCLDDPELLGKSGRLAVEGVVGDTTDVVDQPIRITAPGEADLASTYVSLVWLARSARIATRVFAESLRMVIRGREVADRLAQVAAGAPPSRTVDLVSRHIGALQQYFRLSRRLWEMRRDGASPQLWGDGDDEVRELLDVAYGPERELELSSIGTTEWDDETWARHFLRLGFESEDAYDRWLRPRIQDLELSPESFEAGVLKLLLDEGRLDTEDPEFNLPPVSSAFVELGNMLLLAGWASFKDGEIILTKVGRLQVERLVRTSGF